MVIHPVVQGSDAWMDLHLSVPTASRFGRLITPKTRKISSQVHSVACELAAEWMVGGTVDPVMTQFMQRGLKLEKQALAWYAFDRDVEVQPVGFVTLDDGSAGCSPDGLIGHDGGVEIKCPSPVAQVEHLTDTEEFTNQYRAQVQGGMWICDRQWWDLVSWHPSIPAVIVRIERDEDYIATLAEAVAMVNAEVNQILIATGYREDRVSGFPFPGDGRPAGAHAAQ